MERLTSALLILAGVLVSCTPDPRAVLDARFHGDATALWVTHYEEDPESHQFVRTSAWGQVPEKLVADGLGGFSVAVPLLLQGETSDGPLPDQFWTVLVRVVRHGDEFTLAPNDALPGTYQSWHDAGRRMIWFVGKTWQFQGRY